jgi:hypothetical protein
MAVCRTTTAVLAALERPATVRFVLRISWPMSANGMVRPRSCAANKLCRSFAVRHLVVLK